VRWQRLTLDIARGIHSTRSVLSTSAFAPLRFEYGGEQVLAGCSLIALLLPRLVNAHVCGARQVQHDDMHICKARLSVQVGIKNADRFGAIHV
jgi:hypothetical protein